MPEVDEILEMVDTHERDSEVLRSRMDGDSGLYRLEEHVNRDPVTKEILKNYATFTSSSPRSYADKVISWLVLAELLIRVEHMEAGAHPDQVDNLKERFADGCLRAADERLKRRAEPSLRRQQALFCSVLGGYIGGRALLVNRADGSSYPDITAWDPMHIRFGVTAEGLDWMAYKVKKTAAQLRGAYPEADLSWLRDRSGRGSTDVEKEGVWCVDWYDENVNTLIADGKVLKPATLHGSPRVPCYLTLVGAMPARQSQGASNLMAGVGESIYAGAREVYRKKNDVLSIMAELVARARRQTVITESADGKKTLPEDPFKEGTEIALRTGDKIYTLVMQKMAEDAPAYLQALLGEEQRATLPFSSYGETPFQLSGFAITQLRQATETVIASRVEALTDMYEQIVHLLYDQFMTGNFNGMKLSGRDRSRNYFSMYMSPEMLVNSCDYTVRLTSQLPQDDAANWQVARTAKETGLLSDDDIRDNILKLQDSQQAADKIRAQKAKELLPEAVLFELMKAAEARGDIVIAKMYLAEFQRLMAVKLGIMPEAGGGAPGQEPGQGGAGMPPEVLPHALTGAAPQPETSNDGPSRVAPGTPRPGRRRQNAARR